MRLFAAKTKDLCFEGSFTAASVCSAYSERKRRNTHPIMTKKGGIKLSNYFNRNDARQFAFYRVPKALFTEEKYKPLSTDSKMLYGLLLDRMSLSEKNGWIDRQGRVYQFFTVQQAQELLNFGHEKICRLFAELSEAGLIERKRQGLGRASIIYLKKFL